MKPAYLSTAQMEAGLPDILDSPRDRGKVEAIVIRPREDERKLLENASLSPESGLEGDRWLTSSGITLPDGRPDPRAQVSLMNARILRLIARSKDRMPLAGDNLIVDLDLSEANMPVGQKLVIGDTLLEITDVPHTGCDKFANRFGPDARRFVNAREHKSLHLRGIYARVLKAGQIRVGDEVQKLATGETA